MTEDNWGKMVGDLYRSTTTTITLPLSFQLPFFISVSLCDAIPNQNISSFSGAREVPYLSGSWEEVVNGHRKEYAHTA